jgi:hypothetical protein
LIFFSFFSPNNQNYIHDERNEYNNSHHYSLSSKSPILSRNINEKNILLNYENEDSNNPLLSSSKVKWMGAVRTVAQLSQVRKKKQQILIRNIRIRGENIFLTPNVYDLHLLYSFLSIHTLFRFQMSYILLLGSLVSKIG